MGGSPKRSAIAGLAAVGLLTLMADAQEPPLGGIPVAPGDRLPAPPAATPAPDSVYRQIWDHAEGTCQFIDKGEENWVELDKVGAVAFRFKETRRNCDFVELHDRDRGLTVRLYKNAPFISGLGDEDWLMYYHGRWVK